MTHQAKARDEALQELQIILRAVATVATLDRVWAFRYTHCRDLLLRSDLRTVLPGFLRQCVTLDNFHAFIRFYHPHARQRHEYIDEAFEKCWAYQLEHVLAREATVRLGNVRAHLLPPPPSALAAIEGRVIRIA